MNEQNQKVHRPGICKSQSELNVMAMLFGAINRFSVPLMLAALALAWSNLAYSADEVKDEYPSRDALLASLSPSQIIDHSESATPFVVCKLSAGSGFIYKSVLIYAPGLSSGIWVRVYWRKFNTAWLDTELKPDGFYIKDAVGKVMECISPVSLSMERKHYTWRDARTGAGQ